MQHKAVLFTSLTHFPKKLPTAFIKIIVVAQYFRACVSNFRKSPNKTGNFIERYTNCFKHQQRSNLNAPVNTVRCGL